MNEWELVQLGELVEITHGYAFKGEYFTDEMTRDVLVTPGNFLIGGGFNDQTCKYYAGPVPTDYVLSEGDLIVTMTDLSKAGDTLGYSAIVPKHAPERRYLHNQRIGRVILTSPERADLNFLYFLMRTHQYRQEVLASASGSSVRHTSPTRIKAYKFRLPPLSLQREIAHILSSLDDKIDLNRRMNATLESMARALFKSWFVDFDPVRAKADGRQPDGIDADTAALFPDSFEDSDFGPIPAGWHVAPLSEHIEAERGLSYNGDGLSDESAGLPMHNLNSIYEGGGYKYEGIKYYTGNYQERHVAKAGDLIIANTEQGHFRLLIGFPALIPKRYPTGLFSHHLYKVSSRSDSHITTRYLYFLFRTRRFHSLISGYSNGTTVNMLPPDSLERPKFVVPPAAIVTRFDEIMQPILDKLDVSYSETLQLTATRDALLPRLMSGELEV